jgi:hypothetical protein
MTLSQAGDFFHATERFGNTYKFDMTDSGCCAEIENFFGKTLFLSTRPMDFTLSLMTTIAR